LTEFKIIGSINIDLSHKDLNNHSQKFRGAAGLWYYDVEYEIVSWVTEPLVGIYFLLVQALWYDGILHEVKIPLSKKSQSFLDAGHG
jgi:hypothetical protein